MAVPGREASAANGTAPMESPTESLPNDYDPWDELVSGKFPIISQIIDDASQLHDAAEQCFDKQVNKDERSVLTWLNSLKDDMEPGKTHSYDSQLEDCHMFVMLLRELARNEDLERHKAKLIEAIARDVDDNLRLHQSNTHSSTTGTTLYRWIHARSFGNPATAEASPENSVLIVDDRSQIRLEQTFSPLKQSLMHAHDAHQAKLTPGDRTGQASATAVPPCIVALCGDVPGMLNGMQQMQTSMSGSAAAHNEAAAQQQRKLIADAQGGGVYALHQHAPQGLPQPHKMDEPSTPSDLVLLAVSLCASDDPDNASPCSYERNSDGCAEIDSRTQDQDAFVHERNCCSLRSALEAANTVICFFSKKQTENMRQEAMQAKLNAEALRGRHTHRREGRRPPVEESDSVETHRREGMFTKPIYEDEVEPEEVPSTPPVKPSDCFYPLQLLHDCLERFPKNGPFVNSTSPLNLYCVFDVSQQFFEESNVKEVMQLWIDNLFTSESDEVMSNPDRSTSKSSKNTSSSTSSSASSTADTSTPSTHVHVAIKLTCSFQTLSTFRETCPQLLSRAPPVDSYWVHSASGIVSETVNPVRSTGAGLHGTAHVGMAHAIDATEWPRTAKTRQYAQRTRSGKILLNGPCLQNVFPHCSSGLTRLERLLRAWHGNVRVLTCTGIGSASQKALTLLNEMGCMAFATNTACSASAQAERIADGPEGMCPECSIHVGYRVMADHSTLLLFFAVCRTTPTGASTPSSPHECPALVVAHKLAHVTVITCDEADRSSAQKIEPAVKDLMERMCMGRGMEAAFPAGHLLLVSEPSKDAGKLPGGVPLSSGRAHLDQLQDYVAPYPVHYNDNAAEHNLDANTSQQRNEADVEAAAEATEDTNELSPSSQSWQPPSQSRQPPSQSRQPPSQSRQPAPEAGIAVLTKGEMMKWLLTPRRDRQPETATWRHGAEFLNCLRLLLFKRGSMVKCADQLRLSAALSEQYEALLNDLDTLITTGGRLQPGATSDGIAMPLAGHYQPATCIPFKFENRAWHKQDLTERDLEQLRRLATELSESSATMAEFKQKISQEHGEQVKARRKLGEDWLAMWAKSFERVDRRSRQFLQRAEDRLDLLSNGEKLCLRDIGQDVSDNFSMPCLLPDGHNHQACDILIGRKNGRHPLCNLRCTLCTEDGDGDFCRKPIGHHLQIIGEEGRRHLCSSGEVKHQCPGECYLWKASRDHTCDRQCSYLKGHASRSGIHQCACSKKPVDHECRELCELSDHAGCRKYTVDGGGYCHYGAQRENHAHLCGSTEHECKAVCTVPGRCYDAPCVDQASSSKGQLSASSSQHQSDCSYRKQCSNKIPPDGIVCNKHSCGKPKKEHYCTTRCSLCNEPCNRMYGHAGRCKVEQHGKVNQPQRVWNREHGYVFTIPANTVDCKGLCSKAGPSHTHIIRKQRLEPGLWRDWCEEEDYIEIGHSLFWKETMPVVDPSDASVVDEYNRCSALCPVKAHEHMAEYVEVTKTDNSEQCPKFCSGDLLHDPMKPNGQDMVGKGYYSKQLNTDTKEHHYFKCELRCMEPCDENSSTADLDGYPGYHSSDCAKRRWHEPREHDCKDENKHRCREACMSHPREESKSCHLKVGRGHEENGKARRHACSENQGCGMKCVIPNCKERDNYCKHYHAHMDGPGVGHLCTTHSTGWCLKPEEDGMMDPPRLCIEVQHAPGGCTYYDFQTGSSKWSGKLSAPSVENNSSFASNRQLQSTASHNDSASHRSNPASCTHTTRSLPKPSDLDLNSSARQPEVRSQEQASGSSSNSSSLNASRNGTPVQHERRNPIARTLSDSTKSRQITTPSPARTPVTPTSTGSTPGGIPHVPPNSARPTALPHSLSMDARHTGAGQIRSLSEQRSVDITQSLPPSMSGGAQIRTPTSRPVGEENPQPPINHPSNRPSDAIARNPSKSTESWQISTPSPAPTPVTPTNTGSTPRGIPRMHPNVAGSPALHHSQSVEIGYAGAGQKWRQSEQRSVDITQSLPPSMPGGAQIRTPTSRPVGEENPQPPINHPSNRPADAIARNPSKSTESRQITTPSPAPTPVVLPSTGSAPGGIPQMHPNNAGSPAGVRAEDSQPGGHLQRLRSDSGSILPRPLPPGGRPRPRRNTEPARNLPDVSRSTHESPPAAREGMQLLVDVDAPAPQPTTAAAVASADTVSEDALPDEQFDFDSLARVRHQSNSAPDSALSDQQASGPGS